MAGDTLRWRGGMPHQKVDKESDDKMKLMEMAFRMGKEAGSGSSSSHGASSANSRPRFPLLALEDGKVEEPPAEATEWM